MISFHKCSIAAAIAAFNGFSVPEGDKEQGQANEEKLKYCLGVLSGTPTHFDMESLSMEDLLGRMVSEQRVPLIQDHILFEEESKKSELLNKKKRRNARRTLFHFLTFVIQHMFSIDELPAKYLGELDGKQQIHWTSLIITYVWPKILDDRVSGPKTPPLLRCANLREAVVVPKEEPVVFDDVYGNVPKETYDQWNQDAIDLEKNRSLEAVKRQGHMLPLVRNPDVDWALPNDIIIERTVPPMEDTNGSGGVIMMETGGASRDKDPYLQPASSPLLSQKRIAASGDVEAVSSFLKAGDDVHSTAGYCCILRSWVRFIIILIV